MDIQEIDYRIQKCKDKIYENDFMIKEVRKEIKKYEHAIENLKETEGNLIKYRNSNKVKYVSLKEKCNNNKFASLCSDSVIRFVDGSEAIQVHEDIADSIKITRKKIENKYDEINGRERENSRLTNEIFELERERQRVLQES